MWFSIDFNSPIPVYRQIKDKIKSMVASNEINKGEYIPSIRKLAKNIGVNLNTVSRAYRELESEGTLKVVRGKGYKISDFNKEKYLQKKIEKYKKVSKECLNSGINKNLLKGLLDQIYRSDKNA